MKIKYYIGIIVTFLTLLVSQPGICLLSRDIVRLKQAGVGDQTIQVIVAEKIVETAAFSVQDIIDMKKAGIGGETLQLILKENSFLKDRQPIIYGKDIRSIQFTTAKDIIELKNAGVSDAVLEAVVKASRDKNADEREQALELLRNMGIVVDFRRRR
jgi:hypothetical protein